MSALEPSEAAAAKDVAAKASAKPAMRIERVVLVLFALMVGMLITLGAGVRYGARTQAGRAAVVRLLDGMPLGGIGRLHVAGMSGDPFDAFGFKELSIIDTKGTWLEIHDLSLMWDPVELLARRVHATRIHARLVAILRQPQVAKAPSQPPSKLPVSLVIDDLRLQLETAPAFSVQRGLWDVSANGDLRRNGKVRTRLSAKSLLHPGDGLSLVFKLGRKERFLLRADALEARGGALAGALGLPANQPLKIHAVGDGMAAHGSAQLIAQSGEITPLQASVAWAEGGLSVNGRVSLASSRLTKFFADRLGPEAEITLSAKQAKGAVYIVDGALLAKDGAVRLTGPINWDRKATPGLQMALTVSDFSKWFGLIKIGPAQANGVFAGDLNGFTYKGAFQGNHLDHDGYVLARIGGPAAVTFKKNEWRVVADLAGAGGGGKGMFTTFLGASPRMQLDFSRLADGRALFRTLNVFGSGVKILAQGGQELFGRLSFKGTAQITDIGLIRHGAHGSLDATWDAGESRDAKAWDFSVDSVGARFSSGLTNLDHFLGASPHLSAKGAYGAGAWTFSQAKLVGAMVQIDGKGEVDAKADLSIDLNWTARGPVTLGPLEVAGAAKGTGKITGALSAPRADLTADLASMDLSPLVIAPAHLTLTLLQGADGLTGVAALTGPTAKYGPATAKAAFRFQGDGIDLSDIAADAGGVRLSGGLSLRSGEPSSADLNLVAGPGAFLSSGRLNGVVKIISGPEGSTAHLILDGKDVAAVGAPTTFHTLSVRADGPLKQLPFQVAADSVEPVAWAFKGDGVLKHAPPLDQVTLQGAGRFRKADFKLLEPAVVRLGGAEQDAHIKLAVAGGQAIVDVREAADVLNAKADLSNVALASLAEDFVGTVGGTLTLHGKGGRLDGSMDAALTGARSRDAPANEGLTGAVKATLTGDRVHVEAQATNAEGLKSNGSIDLPAEASAAPFRIALDRTKPVKGSFSADGEVRPLWDLFAGGERTLSGHVSTSGTIQGNLNMLRASGEGALTGGKFRDVTTGLALQNLEMASSFGDDAVTVRRFSAADARGGTISGDGRVSFAEDGASTFTLNLKKFQLLDNEIGRATASGAVTVTHPAKGQGKLSGQLVIDRADIVAATPTPTGVVPMDVVEINQTIRPGQEKPPARTLGPPINLDVAIKADRGVYVKGKGLAVELSLDSHVGGTIVQPTLSGQARVVTGSYDFAGKRFDMDSSGVIHLGTSPSQIRLSLSATWEDPTLTAVVRVQGTAAKPEITLTSTPVLPQDEVLSRVLFGVSASQLSPAQGAELASALASLTGGGGFDVIGNLRQFAGLDRLALGGTTTTGTTISGGKYVTKDLYLELTGGGRNGSAAQLEWRIRHNLSLVTRYGAALDTRYSGDEDASLSIRFRKDF